MILINIIRIKAMIFSFTKQNTRTADVSNKYNVRQDVLLQFNQRKL